MDGKSPKSNGRPPPKRPAKGDKPVARPVAVATVAAAVATNPQPDPAGPGQGAMLKKRDLLEAVVARSGVKKKHARAVLDAALAVLGEAVAEGRELNLPPFGKVKYARTRDGASARVVQAKIRQGKSVRADEKPAQDGLADTGEGR